MIVENPDSQRAVRSRAFSVAVLPVVLVHGVRGTPESFGAMAALLQQHRGLVVARPFDYSDKTPDTGTWNIERLAGELHKHIQCVLNGQCIDDPKFAVGTQVNGVQIVAHSMGGLIARAYLADMARDRFDGDAPIAYNGKIRRLAIVGTPNYGAKLATLLSFIGSFVTQTREMEFGSNFLWSLHERWRTTVLPEHRIPNEGILAIAGTTGRAACLSIDDGLVSIPSAVIPVEFLSDTQIRYVPFQHSIELAVVCSSEPAIPLVGIDDETHSTFQLVRNFLLGEPVPQLYSPPSLVTQFGLLTARLVDKPTQTPVCSTPISPLNISCSFPKAPLLIDSKAQTQYPNPSAGTSTVWPLREGDYTVTVEPPIGYKRPMPTSIHLEAGRPLVLPAFELVRAPDLVVTGLALSLPLGCIRRGHSEVASFGVRNQGLSTAAPTTVAFYVSSDASLSQDDTRVAQLNLSALGPSSTVISNTRVTFPDSLPKGQQIFFIAVADSEKMVDESNEDNNRRTIAAPVCNF